MRELSKSELKEKAELVKFYLSELWSIHVSLRKADVPYRYHPDVRKLIAKELKAYNVRARNKYKKFRP